MKASIRLSNFFTQEEKIKYLERNGYSVKESKITIFVRTIYHDELSEETYNYLSIFDKLGNEIHRPDSEYDIFEGGLNLTFEKLLKSKLLQL